MNKCTNTIVSRTECLAGNRPDVSAFISFDENGGKKIISRGQLFSYAKRLAHRLQGLGAKNGTIICNALPNTLERVVAEFGIIFSGAASMNGQIFRADGEDFISSLKSSKCFMVIVDPDASNRGRQILLKEVPLGCEEAVRSTRLPDLKYVFLCKRDSVNVSNDFLSSLDDPTLPEYMASVNPDDLATVMTTSGTTGFTKLVKKTHANLFPTPLVDQPLRFLSCAPLGWTAGYVLMFLRQGWTRYFIDMQSKLKKDLSATIWNIVLEEQIQVAYMSPILINAILSNKTLWENTPWKLIALVSGGQPMKKHLMGAINTICSSLKIFYGSTESGSVSALTVTEGSTYSENLCGSIRPGVEVKIVNDQGKVSMLFSFLRNWNIQ